VALPVGSRQGVGNRVLQAEFPLNEKVAGNSIQDSREIRLS